MTRVPAVVGIKRDTTSDIQIPSLTISVGKTVARVAGGWCPHPGSRSAADKLGLGTDNSTVPGPQLITIAAGSQLRIEVAYPGSQTVQDCTRSFLTSARAAFPPATATFS